MRFLIFFLCLLCLSLKANAQNINDKIVLIDSTSKMPQFVGGTYALIQYLHSNLLHPTKIKKDKFVGTVKVSFVVEKDGSLSEFEIMKSISPDCDKEAIRVLKDSPKWEVGLQGNQAVRVRMTLDIDFSERPHYLHCPCQYVYQEPTFPGGKRKFIKYIYLRLQHGGTTKKNKIKGVIWTEFLINKNGKVGNIQIIKGLNPEADKEVIKVLESTPRWTPRKYRGKSINTKMYVPIIYFPDFNIRDKEQNILFFLDGKEILKYDFMKIEPETIKDIELINKKKLKKQYGKKARNGAVLIYTIQQH